MRSRPLAGNAPLAVALAVALAALLAALSPAKAVAQEESVLQQQDAARQEAAADQRGTTPRNGAEVTLYDDTGTLSAPEARKVQKALDRVRDEEGEPLYVFLVNEPGVKSAPQRHQYLVIKARQARVPEGAGVLLLDPVNRWGQVELGRLPGAPEDVFDAIISDMGEQGISSALVSGAEEIVGHDLPDARDAPDENEPGSPFGAIFAVCSIGAGAALLVWRSVSVERRRRRAGDGGEDEPEKERG